MSSTYFIVSAEKRECSPQDNFRRTRQLQLMLETAGLSFTTVTGFYEGVGEMSLIVHPNGQSAEVVRTLVKHAANNFHQDSILELNDEGYAWLLFPRGSNEQFLGKMTTSKTVDPKKVTAYTALPNGTYLHLEGENV